jgi:murein L,D-transpeptidase YafK
MYDVLLITLAAAAAVAWASHHGDPLPPGARADLILVEKARRRLTLYADGRPLKSYRVALGWNPAGHKQREGDGRTPEGRYHIDLKKADSAFHRGLRMSYPDAADREAARRRGDDPGGAVMIHGLRSGCGWLGNLHRLRDWTAGCIALTDREIEELWEAVAVGTVVEVRP